MTAPTRLVYFLIQGAAQPTPPDQIRPTTTPIFPSAVSFYRGRVSGNKEKKQKKEGSHEHAKNRRRKSNRTNRSISRVRGSCACCRCLRLVGAWLVGGSPAQESRRNFDPRGGTKFAKNDDDDPVTKGRAPGDKGAVQRRTLREAWRTGLCACAGGHLGPPLLHSSRQR